MVPLAPSLVVATPPGPPLPFPTVGVPASRFPGTVGPDEPVPRLGLTAVVELPGLAPPDPVEPCARTADALPVAIIAATVTIVISLVMGNLLLFRIVLIDAQKEHPAPG
jgi:hypothetical protein